MLDFKTFYDAVNQKNISDNCIITILREKEGFYMRESKKIELL